MMGLGTGLADRRSDRNGETGLQSHSGVQNGCTKLLLLFPGPLVRDRASPIVLVRFVVLI